MATAAPVPGMEVSTTSPNPRRRFLLAMVAALAQEIGYDKVEDSTIIETLLEMFQSLLMELGRTTRQFTELAGRMDPNVGDVTMAMADLGIRIDPVGLRTFMKRPPGRAIIPSPQGLPQPKNPTILSVGKRRPLPSYIPEYFPPMPDPHTYIRTPTHRQPITDYATCREKLSQHNRDLARSLAKFYAKTLQCSYLFPENQSLFPFITPKPVSSFDHLIPRDQIFEEEQSQLRINMVKKNPAEIVPRLNDGDVEIETELVHVPEDDKWELIDSPFLRPVKKFKPPLSAMAMRKSM